ncbi:hypothetical protein ASD11_14885 [Aeromicrobium sp. Root495]|uniref:DUF6286 domain-containing protein n=1 Tax=Aeromicrobium sp. Root495 TaxID=1736550 RepID=UPI000701B150|nr:DUF6286 domain-containing protein [Aeromicrobium sp. Root495]KQY55789.1 hypothetical protein ASD11_14885 [Aeromicrobium sp. Root495]
MSTIPAPRARPAASAVAVVVALLLVGLAVVAVRELALAQGWATGASWTGAVVDRADGRSADVASTVVGVVAAVVGLWLVLLAVKPARRTHRRTQLDSDTWISDNAILTLVTRAAEDTPGVAEAAARTRRSRVVVTVQSDHSDATTEVEKNVRAALHGLSTKDVIVRKEQVSYDA